jgi:hypothetical protein
MICGNCQGQRYFEAYFPCPECNGTGIVSCCGDIEGTGNMEAVEFDCVDCNVHVYSWGGNTTRCATCQFIHNRPDLTEKEIAEIRIITHTPILPKKEKSNG